MNNLFKFLFLMAVLVPSADICVADLPSPPSPHRSGTVGGDVNRYNTELEQLFAHERPLVCYCCCDVPGGQRCVDKPVAECLGRGCKCIGPYK